MSPEKIIKAQSREKLKHGGWSKALIGLGIIAIFYMIIECIASVEYYLLDAYTFSETIEFIIKVSSGSIVTISVFLLSPVILGYLRMMYTDEKEYDASDIVYYFRGFKKYAKAVAFVFSYALRMVIPILVFFSLVFVLIAVKYFWLKDIVSEETYITSLVLLIIISTVNLLIYNIRYFVSVLLFSEDDSKPLSFYFTTSKKIMSGHYNDVMKLTFSFYGWILSCIAVMPAIYVIPYMTQAYCISGKWIAELSRNGQNL